MAAIAPFQQAYLGACLTRMSDAATAAFPGGSRALPTSAELQKFIGYILPSFPCRPILCCSGLGPCCIQMDETLLGGVPANGGHCILHRPKMSIYGTI